ncbi:DoxX family protein [Flavobacterium saliperosum S13]|uniref:DoxX family protein n=2 Tax=Flavobacterium saliperosum TaxID=329186 RepID=A0ABN0QDF6_9FLAO|nr:DoxX family membrane protein [Flavobacterium saliperosum]ESU22509.1 DoxX family protein [Flavobacterium saliperosum S13]SCX18627.1 putative oxidoreductase [Flavobacterium saliperosum]
MKSTFLLRFAVAVILIMHSVPGMFNNGVNDFGNLYLNTIGFAPFGLAIAWSIKLSHVAAALLLLLNKYVKPAAIITILILVVGIFMVHLPDGWYVVGGGRNGVEFNFLLIFVLLVIMYPNGITKKTVASHS